MVSKAIFKGMIEQTVNECLPNEAKLFALFGDEVIEDVYLEKKIDKNIVKYDFLENPKDIVDFALLSFGLYKALKEIYELIKTKDKKSAINETGVILKENLISGGMVEEKVIKVVENVLTLISKVI